MHRQPAGQASGLPDNPDRHTTRTDQTGPSPRPATPQPARQPQPHPAAGAADHPQSAEPGTPPGALLYTPEQAAALLQVSPTWLRRKAAARAVPCTFIGKHLRFSRDDLAAILAAGASSPERPRRQPPR
jgi:excisionase family DNA binding protein